MKKKTMKKIDTVATVIVLTGALNWGFAVFDFNLVSTIFGSFSDWVYGIVGISAIVVGWNKFMK